MANAHWIVQVPIVRWHAAYINTHVDADEYADAHTDCNLHADSDGHRDARTDANVYADPDADEYSDTDQYSNADGHPHGDVNARRVPERFGRLLSHGQ